MLIRDTPAHERPRERLLSQGAAQLDSASLIAILLRTGTKGVSALTVAQQLLNHFQTLQRLSQATIPELRQIKGIGRDKAIALQSAFTLATRMARELHAELPILDTPEKIVALLREECRASQVEVFLVILLNARRRLISVEKVSQGTVDATVAHAREVFRTAITSNASAIILAHNHPSGDPTPSDADIRVTRDLIRAGQVLHLEVLDHVIVGRPGVAGGREYVSLRELGLFYA